MNSNSEPVQRGEPPDLEWSTRRVDARAQASGSIRVPSPEVLERARRLALETETGPDLRQRVIVLEQAARRCGAAFEEVIRLSLFRLNLERDIGRMLGRSLVRGGDRSRSSTSTLRNLGLSKNQSSRLQRLAAIPEDVFQAYAAASVSSRKLPSARGALNYGARGGQGEVGEVSDSQVDGHAMRSAEAAALRHLGSVDFALGFREELEVDGRCLRSAEGVKLRGRVMALVGRDDELVDQLAGLAASGVVEDCVALLRRRADCRWLRRIASGAWSICLVRPGSDVIAAHCGGRRRSFELVFRQVGIVLSPVHATYHARAIT